MKHGERERERVRINDLNKVQRFCGSLSGRGEGR